MREREYRVTGPMDRALQVRLVDADPGQPARAEEAATTSGSVTAAAMI